MNGLPEAADLSHHLSKVARNHVASPIAELLKLSGKPGLLNLSAGLPSPEYFPFETLRADILPPDYFEDKNSSAATSISISKYSSTAVNVPAGPSLSTALQYSLARGNLEPLCTFIRELTSKLFAPLYSNYSTLLNLGSSDGWMKVITTLCNPGEGVLCCEWTYSEALVAMEPFGIQPVPVSMDEQGMRSEALRGVLSGWDETVRGMPRPHVLYIVPVGQNPTGATMNKQRKIEIYDICVEFDVVIIEDDPYYFLQYAPFVPAERRSVSQNVLATGGELSDEAYIASLEPSFSKFDYQGRVVRLDTFSKILAPGSRLGWFTCHPTFADAFERQAEISYKFPSGFSQAIICELLSSWKLSGYFRWLRGLAAQYERRCDILIDRLAEKFDLRLKSQFHTPDQQSSVMCMASSKTGGKENGLVLFSFVPPTAGMFLWLRINFDGHPELTHLGKDGLEKKLWLALIEGGLLISPGNSFSAHRKGNANRNKHQQSDEGVTGHFRLSFSYLSNEDLEMAVDIFAIVLQKFFGVV